jgi:hypothetical protein
MAPKPPRRRMTDNVLAERLDRLAEAANWRAHDDQGRIGRALFALGHALSTGRLSDKKIQRMLSDASAYLQQPEPSILEPGADSGPVALFDDTSQDAYERLRTGITTAMGGTPLAAAKAVALAQRVLTPYDLTFIKRGAKLDAARLTAELGSRRVDAEALLGLGLVACGISRKRVENFEAAHEKRSKRRSS